MDVLETYLTSIEDPVKQEKLRSLFAAITKKFPDLVPVIKWNQPMFTAHETFIIGFSKTKLDSLSAYKVTCALTVEAPSIPLLLFTNSRALLKQALKPAAKSCSGFVAFSTRLPGAVILTRQVQARRSVIQCL